MEELLTHLEKIKEKDSSINDELVIDDKINFEDLYQRTLAKAENGIRVMKVYILKNPITKKDLGEDYLFRAKNKQKLFKEIFYDKEIVESFYLVFERVKPKSKLLKEIVTGIAIPRLEYEGLYNDSLRGAKYSLMMDYNKFLTKSNIITKSLIDFNNNYCRDHQLLDAYAEDEMITHDELCNYIHTLTQKDNYFYLVNFLFQKLESCGYPQGYTIPPYVPDDLAWYYKKINEEKHDIDDSNKIRVKTDKYFSSIHLILEIEENLKKVNELNRGEYIQKLEQIKEKINHSSKEQHFSIDITRDLCSLSVEVEALKKKEFISIETIENFFYHFLKSTSNDLWDKEILEKKRLLYTFINYFEQSKSQISFEKYYEIQNLIFQTLTSVIIYQPKMRNMILKDLTVTYCKGVRIFIQGIVEYLLELDNIKDTSEYYQFLSLIIGEVSDLEFLQYSTILIDKLNKEEIKSLEVFYQKQCQKRIKTT